MRVYRGSEAAAQQFGEQQHMTAKQPNGKSKNVEDLRAAIEEVDAQLAAIEAEVIEQRLDKKRTAQSDPKAWHAADDREHEVRADVARLQDVRVQLESDLAEAEQVEEMRRRRGLAEEAVAISKQLRHARILSERGSQGAVWLNPHWALDGRRLHK